MKKRFLLLVICIFVLLVGCSVKQADNSIAKSTIDTKQSTIKQTDKSTNGTKAIEKFYSDRRDSEPILVNEEIPFEGGTLVLAMELVDGEKYPNLYFVDESGNVTYSTRGSYCWTLNYTQFKGHYIFFGLADVETRQHGESEDINPVKKIDAIFWDKIESVIPEEKIIASINPKGNHTDINEKDAHIFEDYQGYIMISKGQKIPDDLIATLENGDKVSLCKNLVEGEEDMPNYLKVDKADIYNSFAFTFSPMLTSREWEQGYGEGERCLKGKTDQNGNINTLNLRPLGNMSQLDSFILPQDIKPLYLSYNYTREANFSAGEILEVVYPKQRKLLDCRILKLTKEMVDKEIGQDSLQLINANEKNQITLPNEKGYYLFVLRTNMEMEIQTYMGVLKIN